MAHAEINGGICGFVTKVDTHLDGQDCGLTIESDCPSIQKLAAELTSVNPFQEISYQGGRPKVLELAEKLCPHAACPVPAGIIKAIEVETGLALPADVTIKVSKSE